MGKHVYKGEASTKVSHGGLGCPHSQNGNILDLKYLQECLVLEECFGFKKKFIDIVIDRSESAALAISKVQNTMRYPFTQHSI